MRTILATALAASLAAPGFAAAPEDTFTTAAIYATATDLADAHSCAKLRSRTIELMDQLGTYDGEVIYLLALDGDPYAAAAAAGGVAFVLKGCE